MTSIINSECGCVYKEQSLHGGGMIEYYNIQTCLFHGGSDDNIQNYKWLYLSEEPIIELDIEIKNTKETLECQIFSLDFLSTKRNEIVQSRDRFKNMTSDQIREEINNDKIKNNKEEQLKKVIIQIDTMEKKLKSLKNKMNGLIVQ